MAENINNFQLLEDKIVLFQTDIKHLKTDAEKLNAENKDLKTKIGETEASNKKLTEENSNLKSELDELKAKE